MLKPRSIPLALSYADVLLRPGYSEVLPSQTHVATQIGALCLPLPLLSAAMDTVSEAPLAIALARLGGLGVIHKNLSPSMQAAEVAKVKAAAAEQTTSSAVDAHGRLLVAAAVGVGPDTDERASALVAAGADALVVDTAHGHSRGVLLTLHKLRIQYPKVMLVGGNVATAEATRALAEAGAHAVKVGIGPGSICTTRLVAGVGVPQFTAVLECAEEAAAAGVSAIADGGISASGDIVKALAAGAAAVMLGGLFAGTDEAPGETLHVAGQWMKRIRGMGSLGAMRQGSRDRYFQGDVQADKLVPEGVEGLVPARGPLGGVVHHLVGGLRAGMGYVGAATLEDLAKRSQFIQITEAGRRESAVHDVIAGTADPGPHTTQDAT